MPSCEASATRKVIKVYRKWILQEKPTFMTEPEKTAHDEETEEAQQPVEIDTAHHSEVLYTFTHTLACKCLKNKDSFIVVYTWFILSSDYRYLEHHTGRMGIPT